MDFVTHSFRHAEVILSQDQYQESFTELTSAITDITDREIIKSFESRPNPGKSISRDINEILKRNLKDRGWAVESAIFQSSEFNDKRWRLDFAKQSISVEVAFNHGEAIAWNLLKPVLASELNHVEKAIQTEIGIVICATSELKAAGNFDSAVGEFEKFLRYLQPLQDVLTTPMLIIGLSAPRSFRVVGKKIGSRVQGSIEKV